MCEAADGGVHVNILQAGDAVGSAEAEPELTTLQVKLGQVNIRAPKRVAAPAEEKPTEDRLQDEQWQAWDVRPEHRAHHGYAQKKTGRVTAKTLHLRHAATHEGTTELRTLMGEGPTHTSPRDVLPTAIGGAPSGNQLVRVRRRTIQKTTPS